MNSQDLPLLSPELRADFFRYQQILALDPYKTYGVASHNLLEKLASCRALEIDWNGVAYRLVYRVYESPAPKRVLILSFGEHDPAYLNAQARR